MLCQIRGVGRYIAMLIIAEVGDIDRFATARRLCCWAGLTPTVRSSVTARMIRGLAAAWQQPSLPLALIGVSP